MTFELSLPIFAASGLTLLAALTYLGWPKLQIRTYNKMHGGLRVLEVAVILSRSIRLQQHANAEGSAPITEFVIYITLKTGNF